MKTLFFILLFVFPASAIYAQPKFVRVSFTDEDTSKTMAVTWNSNSVSDPSEVF
ncbi:MAG: hypothetical protein FJ088_10535, partial [Deltaproteobacteria bacterium]|nr:hypothetical protein [Deltaproteobacteria bacterium]